MNCRVIEKLGNKTIEQHSQTNEKNDTYVMEQPNGTTSCINGTHS